MSSEIMVVNGGGGGKSDGAPSIIYEVGGNNEEHRDMNSLKNAKSRPKIIDESLLQMPYPVPLYKKPYETLPSNVAIPVGLAQVFIGGAMVICGSLALRYRSYLFYYGTGLWAGTLAGITGALVVMATKQGLPKPRWLCGGRKWQIHVVIAACMLALTASVLVSVFSTSGLMQDTMHSVGVEMGTPTRDEETFERRKSSGIAINAVLLLLAMLEILLTFCSLGIALRILCRSNPPSLFSTESSGSQVTMHEILGTGPEYEARKDRLLRWLGHQRKNFLLSSSPPNSPQRRLAGPPPSVISVPAHRRVPHLVALQPPPPRPILYHPQYVQPRQHGPVGPYGYPVLVPVPFCPLPVRRPITPALDSCSMESKRRRLASGNKGRRESLENGGSSAGTVSSKRSQHSTKNRKKFKEAEITEEEIGRTYTGLDRTMAEDFISNSMDKY